MSDLDERYEIMVWRNPGAHIFRWTGAVHRVVGRKMIQRYRVGLSIGPHITRAATERAGRRRAERDRLNRAAQADAETIRV